MAFSSYAPTTAAPGLDPDPIFAAIAAHRAAWIGAVTAVTAAAAHAAAAELAQREALAALLATPCATDYGASRLRLHFAACLAADGSTLQLGALARGFVEARLSDLARSLGVPRTGPRVPVIRLGDAAAAVALSLHFAAEAAAAVVILAGGALLIGAASLL